MAPVTPRGYPPPPPELFRHRTYSLGRVARLLFTNEGGNRAGSSAGRALGRNLPRAKAADAVADHLVFFAVRSKSIDGWDGYPNLIRDSGSSRMWVVSGLRPGAALRPPAGKWRCGLDTPSARDEEIGSSMELVNREVSDWAQGTDARGEAFHLNRAITSVAMMVYRWRSTRLEKSIGPPEGVCALSKSTRAKRFRRRHRACAIDGEALMRWPRPEVVGHESSRRIFENRWRRNPRLRCAPSDFGAAKETCDGTEHPGKRRSRGRGGLDKGAAGGVRGIVRPCAGGTPARREVPDRRRIVTGADGTALHRGTCGDPTLEMGESASRARLAGTPDDRLRRPFRRPSERDIASGCSRRCACRAGGGDAVSRCTRSDVQIPGPRR